MRLIVGYLATPSGKDGLVLGGAQLARSLGAQLDICMVLPPDRTLPAKVPSEAGYDDILAARAHDWLAEAKASVPEDIQVEVHLSFHESFAQGLLDEVDRLNALAIVVGASGDGLLGRHAIGSVSTELLHSAHVPVALAPRGTRNSAATAIREVTCALGTRVGADIVLNTAVRASELMQVPLRLVSLVALDPPRTICAIIATPPSRPGSVHEITLRTHSTSQEPRSPPRSSPIEVIIADGSTVESAVRQLDWQDGDLVMVGSSRLAQPPQTVPGLDRRQDAARTARTHGRSAKARIHPAGGTVMTSTELSSKGLATGKIGMISGAVLGISSVAPGYTLTASIGLIVAAVGLKMPAIFIAGFIPMFLTAYAYRELNSDTPDCGASFTWSTKAFGPYVGWMCGWGGMVIATIIVLSNLAAIAVDFFYLFIARVVDNPSIADLPGNKFVNVGTTLVFIALATWIASRGGITTSERVQFALVGFQMVLLVVFAVVALVHVAPATPRPDCPST